MDMQSTTIAVAAQMFGSMPGNALAPVSGTMPFTESANKSNITAASQSTAYYPGATTSKALNAASTSITHTSVNLATLKQLIREAIAKSIVGDSDMSTTTSSRTSASAPVTAWKCEKLVHLVAHLVGVILAIVCWC